MPEPSQLLVSRGNQLVDGQGPQAREVAGDGFLERLGSGRGVFVGAAEGFGDDLVDRAEREGLLRREPQGFGRLGAAARRRGRRR